MIDECYEYLFENAMAVELCDSELPKAMKTIDAILEVLIKCPPTAYSEVMEDVLRSNYKLLEYALSDAKGEE